MSCWPFSRPKLWGDGTLRYSRRNIREWLLYYPQIFDCTEVTGSLVWTEVKADIDLAIAGLSPRLREFFRLYCLEQRDLCEIIRVKRWSGDTCDRYWKQIVHDVCCQLCDQEMCSMESWELDNLPPFRSDVWQVPWTDRA